jgi:hypothetical protein
MYRSLFAIIGLLLSSIFSATAREGMWLPPSLGMQAGALKAAGLKLPVSALYNEDGTGLNNAVVLFGRGCTGEMISGEGLVLTNHHCGYGTVQGLSSAARDYFAKGFWALNKQGEIPAPGLTVTFVRRMEEVTKNILSGLPDTMAESERDTIIARRIKSLEKGYRETYPGLEPAIKPFFEGNQYWVTLGETFRDVRLVGFPPNGIGSFGGDTDNWSWPRHTGDFSLFRVYAGKDNGPADYSPNNKPYKPKKFFTLNAGGYKEGDFTMVYGFPGTTQEYLSAAQVAQIADIIDPIRIDVRSARLGAWTQKMQQDRNVFLKYTSKRAGVANGWKKWQGEVLGLREANVVARRREAENTFQEWAAQDTTYPFADDLLSQIQANVAAGNGALAAQIYFSEAVFGVELITRGAVLEKMVAALRAPDSKAALKTAAAGWEGFYRNYDAATDKAVFDTLMPLFFAKAPNYVPDYYRSALRQWGGSFAKWSDFIFANSIATDSATFATFLNSASPADLNRLQNDPALLLYRAAQTVRRDQILPILATTQQRIETLDRLYMKAQLAADPMRAFYPDANLTLRLAWGQVKGIDPEGPAGYSYQTNLNEVMAKDNPAVTEFQVPQKLKDLHARKDWGKWGINGIVPVAFIADNHTTGGNSGSPVLNAKGELIGTNFDRIWEGTMSDLQFDPARCRNISIDVRYTLFVIEKFGGAGWLLNEMKIVR